jgi:hypothetical protein
MRRHSQLAAITLLALAGCKDLTAPAVTLAPPPEARYQLTPSGTLDAEITALVKALFPTGLETAAGTRWGTIRDKLAAGQPSVAKSKLVELSQWVTQKQSQMDPPPNNESRTGAAARLVLYMSLYVYNGPATPPPQDFGAGADAGAGIVTPNAPALIQTTLKHAAARFDVATVGENTVVIVTQSTTLHLKKCSGPRPSRYCSYPLFYHYRAFPDVRFRTPVHMAVCHVHTGEDYGPLPGVDHDELVLAHDKPANESDYTPGGYPVPGEDIEILPKNQGPPPTTPTVTCPGTKYPQVSLFRVPPLPSGPFEKAYAFTARTVNGAARAVGRVLTPRSAYAIDNGVEHNAIDFSEFWNIDTLGHPDLGVTSSSVSPAMPTAGEPVTLRFSVTNHGTAPSTQVSTVIRLQPSGDASPIELMPGVIPPWGDPLYPEESRAQSAEVVLPADLAGGAYTLTAVVSAAGGREELPSMLADNSQPVPLTVASRIPPPEIAFTGLAPGAEGLTNYHFAITNAARYPAELFAPAPDLPSCNNSAVASRMTLQIYDEAGAQRLRLCSFPPNPDLGDFWLPWPSNQSPPPAVYITLNDRLTGQIYQSNLVTIVAPDLQASAITSSRPYGGQQEELSVSFTVRNGGSALAPASVAAVLVGQGTQDQLPLSTGIAIAPLAAGASATYTVTGVIPDRPRGAQLIRVLVDQTQLVLEGNEGNNAVSIPFLVGYPGVDGVFGPEWDGATCQEINVNMPGGGSAPGQLCHRSDATNLYMALRIASPTDIPASGFNVEFDSDNSGTTSNGDDALVSNRALRFLSDNARTVCDGGTVPGQCGPVDVSLPEGKSNGAHAWGFDGSHITGELVHPLNSGDPWDIALAPGATIGVRVLIRLIVPGIPGATDTNLPTPGGYITLQTTPSP